MKTMTLREIMNATDAQIIALGDLEETLHRRVSHITQDSREVTENSLFLAIQGERMNGHRFIPQCFEKGVVACLSSQVIAPTNGGAVLLVPDVRKALLQLAAYYRNRFEIPFVGITGSVGKTTTKDMVASVLSQKFNTLWTQGNYNNDIGVPLTLFRLEDCHEVAVIEMGMNHFGEIHALAEVVHPDIGLISNVGVAHIEYLGSREGILQAKCEMFDFVPAKGVAILNADNDMLSTLEGKLPQQIRWFGMENKKGIYADGLENVGLEATKCVLHTERGEVSVTIPLPGTHMVLNALSAAAVGLELGLSLAEVKAGIESFVPTKNRMQVIKLDSGVTLINDVYNANPVSMKASLDILAGGQGHKAAIVGFMGELGEYAEEMHKDVGAYAAMKEIDTIICIGNCCNDTAAGAKVAGAKNVHCFENQEKFWETGMVLLEKAEIILIKGSRSLALEKTVEKIQGVN